ncbi:hypothetical protein EXIGLDRAFT_696259 [Exidia glandulosa HHB12029]|uniref:F-box domain-containing protein n=1 Tax=Exidia glandulosa HHB12029 TaxID=1314781 RepID=A0A165FGC0_EXIGL|nr:hypothetical protein EXIGLDRAFT_696259 [Exidia glandulosa HHB12029]
MAITRDELIEALRRTVEGTLQQLVAVQAGTDGDLGSMSDVEAENAVSQASDDVYSAVVDTISAYSLRHNNRRARINRIPVELLCASFTHLPFGDLLTATHVCRGWRKVALNHAVLWNEISTRNEQHLATMLERSQSAPLHLDIGTGQAGGDGLLMHLLRNGSLFSDKTHGNNPVLYVLLLPCMPRIRTLRICDFSVPTQLESLLRTPAPQLVHFSLQMPGVQSSKFTASLLFDGFTPRLRTMTLYGIRISRSAFGHLRGLKYLELTGTLNDIADGDIDVVQDVPEVILHWDPATFAGLAMLLSQVPASTREALQLLPPAQSVSKLLAFEKHIRAVHAETGFVREVRSIDPETAASYILEALTESTRTLVTLTIAESLFLRCPAEILPRLEDLTIILFSDVRTIIEQGQLLDMHGRTPQMPQLVRLTLESVSYPTSLLPSHHRTWAMPVPPLQLAAFIGRTGAKPALTMIGVKPSARGVSDPAYQTLVSAVTSIDLRM